MNTPNSLPVISQKFFQLLAKAIEHFAHKIWWRRKLIVLETRMKKPSKKAQNSYQHIRITLLNSLSPEEVSKNFAQYSETFRQRMEQGVLGWGIFDGTKPIGFVWVATKNYFEPTLRIPILLTDEEVYVFDGLIYKGHREGAAPYYIMRFVWNELMKQGFTTSIVLVNEQNRKALLHHYTLRYKERFLRVVAPLLFGRPLRASTHHYSDAKLTRSALSKRKK